MKIVTEYRIQEDETGFWVRASSRYEGFWLSASTRPLYCPPPRGPFKTLEEAGRAFDFAVNPKVHRSVTVEQGV